MFAHTQSLNSSGNWNWDTSNIISYGFQQMFYDAPNFNGDITSWDTSNATTFLDSASPCACAF